MLKRLASLFLVSLFMISITVAVAEARRGGGFGGGAGFRGGGFSGGAGFRGGGFGGAGFRGGIRTGGIRTGFPAAGYGGARYGYVRPGWGHRPGGIYRPRFGYARGYYWPWYGAAFGIGGYPYYLDGDGYYETATPAAVDPAVAACARRFRTYDVASQTYIAKGGRRRSCP